LLRQPKDVSTKEKLDYVTSVLSMLDMNSFADAVVGTAGEGKSWMELIFQSSLVKKRERR
jgi:hypothetical protein